jgi:Zn-dependent M28 family amino/carboxypeptidase
LRTPLRSLQQAARSQELTEAASGILLIGAHYGSVRGCPAANDNGSGVAALFELARRFAEVEPARTMRFVCYKRRQ